MAKTTSSATRKVALPAKKPGKKLGTKTRLSTKYRKMEKLPVEDKEQREIMREMNKLLGQATVEKKEAARASKWLEKETYSCRKRKRSHADKHDRRPNENAYARGDHRRSPKENRAISRKD